MLQVALFCRLIENTCRQKGLTRCFLHVLLNCIQKRQTLKVKFPCFSEFVFSILQINSPRLKILHLSRYKYVGLGEFKSI